MTPAPDLADVALLYLERRRGDLVELREASSRGDFERIRLRAHSFRGTGASYGFEGLTRIGAALEAAARAASPDEVGAQLRRLEDYLERVELRFE